MWRAVVTIISGRINLGLIPSAANPPSVLVKCSPLVNIRVVRLFHHLHDQAVLSFLSLPYDQDLNSYNATTTMYTHVNL